MVGGMKAEWGMCVGAAAFASVPLPLCPLPAFSHSQHYPVCHWRLPPGAGTAHGHARQRAGAVRLVAGVDRLAGQLLSGCCCARAPTSLLEQLSSTAVVLSSTGRLVDGSCIMSGLLLGCCCMRRTAADHSCPVYDSRKPAPPYVESPIDASSRITLTCERRLLLKAGRITTE